MIWLLNRPISRRWSCVGLLLGCLVAEAALGSYSLTAAYEKHKGDYPCIVPVTLQPGADVRHWPAQIYAMPDGEPLHMDVFAPEDAGSYSGVLLVHGGGWQSGTRALLAPLAQALAARGHVAATMDYRLSGRAPFPAPVHDVYAALAYLRAHAVTYGLDGQRLALAGASAGGQLAALAGLAVSESELNPAQVAAPAAIINIDGLWDFTDPLALAYENDPARAQTAAGLYLGGRFERQSARWQQASPLTHLHANAPPILVFTGNAPRFSAGVARLQVQAVRLQLSVTRESVAGPHSFWLFEPWFSPMVVRIHLFLSQQVPPLPAKTLSEN